LRWDIQFWSWRLYEGQIVTLVFVRRIWQIHISTSIM
jgi:hypothetical protein